MLSSQVPLSLSTVVPTAKQSVLYSFSLLAIILPVKMVTLCWSPLFLLLILSMVTSVGVQRKGGKGSTVDVTIIGLMISQAIIALIHGLVATHGSPRPCSLHITMGVLASGL